MSMTITTGDDRDDDDDRAVGVQDDERDDQSDDRDGDRRSRDRGRGIEGDDADESDSDTDDDDDRSPDELKAEIRRLRSSLSKANSSGNRRRQQLKELRAANAALADSDDPDAAEDDDEAEAARPNRSNIPLDVREVQRSISKAVKRRERELEEQHRRDLIDTRAESALIRAGVSEKNLRLLKRELDYDELEVLKDRTVDGIDDEIDRLRSEFPDLFRRGKVGARRINGGDDRESRKPAKPMTASERQAASLRGRG